MRTNSISSASLWFIIIAGIATAQNRTSVGKKELIFIYDAD
jgi:hypothetical protein